MSTISEELQSFYQFVELRLHSAHCNDSLDELYAEWRASNRSAAEHDRDVRAIRASLRDMDEGNTGRPIQEFAAEFRQRNGL